MNHVESMFRKKYYAQLYEVSSRLMQPSRLLREPKWMEETHLILHSLKGTAGTVGLPRLSHMAETALSMFTRDDEFNLPFYMLDTLHALIQSMIGELQSPDFSRIENNIVAEMQKFNEEDGRPKRILIIDDDETLLASMHEILSSAGFEVEILSNPQMGLNIMLDTQPDCIILDVMLPETTGFDIIQQIRSDVQRELTPVLFLTARSDMGDKYKGLQLGADEYLTKPFHFEELMLRIKTLITRVEKYRTLSMRDQLTGLYNRRYLLNRLDELISAHARKPFPLSLAILDLDFFKKVNDTYGHPCGDTVLKTFAQVLNDNLRETDIVTRYGGEEFIILLPDTDQDEALAVLTRIREKFSQTQIKGTKASFLQTFSGGISQLSEGIDTIPTLIEQADKALYLAKYKGRNTICLASDKDDTTENKSAKKC
ncbi:diguanylate cyclase [Aneurinibacillus sp. Ricciae_BoGa-3]|uniref:diguanylate cyclase n=1 Tax=Aneurinibacillus sp. Ricciae_BoGa-3 TaxID=3022697 RepID=UPI002340583C|nr:diguanylate cyclase [Aneurinibacillus sp. Ricciae_BoGa-3]WCK55826.1 diguanylate cyclase [Aneurinibacillus sp. Ricciae_BoGa-3]